MLRKPILALTSDRTKTAEKNNVCGDPEDWFDSEYFRRYSIYSASFDFFVDWSTDSVCDEVWIKRISDTDDIWHKNEKELLDLILACDGKGKANSNYWFLKTQGIKEKYMLFRDVTEERWKNGEEYLVEVDLSMYRHNPISYWDADGIQKKIENLRRKPVSIGGGGLRYSTSSLEGYLSKQQYFWPGDADTVLYDRKNRAAAVIEFKKHTAHSKIPFREQCLSNYLNRDILKYKSLALLRDRLETKLFVLYYPIPKNISYIIVEEVRGTPDSLQVDRRVEMELPKKADKSSMDTFAERFVYEFL